MLATMSDAHAEWHRNARKPMGLFTCPWDACDPGEWAEFDPEGYAEAYARWEAAEAAYAELEAEAEAEYRQCVHGMNADLCADPVTHYGPDA